MHMKAGGATPSTGSPERAWANGCQRAVGAHGPELESRRRIIPDLAPNEGGTLTSGQGCGT